MFLDTKDYTYSYKDGNDYVFVDKETFEPVTLSRRHGRRHDAVPAGERRPARSPSTTARRCRWSCRRTVTLKVVETEPGIKGATAAAQTKAATLETGLVRAGAVVHHAGRGDPHRHHRRQGQVPPPLEGVGRKSFYHRGHREHREKRRRRTRHCFKTNICLLCLFLSVSLGLNLLPLFHRDALGQVARLVHVAAAQQRRCGRPAVAAGSPPRSAAGTPARPGRRSRRRPGRPPPRRPRCATAITGPPRALISSRLLITLSKTRPRGTRNTDGVSSSTRAIGPCFISAAG